MQAANMAKLSEGLTITVKPVLVATSVKQPFEASVSVPNQDKLVLMYLY